MTAKPRTEVQNNPDLTVTAGEDPAMTTIVPARDCRVYHRRSVKAREVPVPELLTLAVAKARAAAISWHPIPDLRPFYVAVYDGVSAYPVAVYANGEELTGDALVTVLATLHTERPHTYQEAGR